MHSHQFNTCDRKILPVINLYNSHYDDANHPHEPIHSLVEKRLQLGTPFFGIEVSPYTTPNAPMAELNLNTFAALPCGVPLFVSTTWMAPDNVHTQPIVEAPSIRVAQAIRSVPVLMHITCGDLTADKLDHILAATGITNVMALRGDYVSPSQPMRHASDLISAIRTQHPAQISIAVAAYPDGHPDAPSAAADLQRLVDKVACGANLIITQICFSPTSLIQFIDQCRSTGIAIPILVGIFVPSTYASLVAVCRLCGVAMPVADLDAYRRRADDAVRFRAYSLGRAKAMIGELLDHGVVGFQFFTFNRFDVLLELLREVF